MANAVIYILHTHTQHLSLHHTHPHCCRMYIHEHKHRYSIYIPHASHTLYKPIRIRFLYTSLCHIPLYTHAQKHRNAQKTFNCAHTPGSLSLIATNAMSYGPISTAPGWSVEIIITLKYSDSSVMLLSMVDTIKMADVLPTVKVTVYGPLS